MNASSKSRVSHTTSCREVLSLTLSGSEQLSRGRRWRNRSSICPSRLLPYVRLSPGFVSSPVVVPFPLASKPIEPLRIHALSFRVPLLLGGHRYYQCRYLTTSIRPGKQTSVLSP